MSAFPVIYPSGLGCRVKRKTHGTWASQGDADALKAGLVHPGLSGRISATDFFVNAAARIGWGTPSVPEGADYKLVRLSNNYWLMITLYRNHWITRRIIDGPATDMVRAWPKIVSEMDPGDISKVDRLIQHTQTRRNILTTLKWARLFGGAGALIVIDGHEGMLDKPLDLDTVELGSYRGLIPFDRWTGIVPSAEISTDVTKPREFNLPVRYDVTPIGGGSRFTVHASRILRFCGPEVPSPEYQAQQYWGISVIEPAYEEMRKRDNMSWNILAMTFRASIIAMKDKNLAQMLSGVSMNQNALVQFQARMQAMNELLSNQSMLIVPEEGGMDHISYSLTGFADVYQQFQLDIAGATGMTVTRLFGRTITGLGQTNDADERLYEERIAMDQEEQLRPQIEKLYSVIMMSEVGKVPDDLQLKFPSVRVLSEEEKSKIATDFTANVTGMVNAGIMNKPQALKEIRQQSDLTGFGSNITDEDVEQAERDEELGLAEPLGEEVRKEEVRMGADPDADEAEKHDAESIANLGKAGAKDSKVIDHISFHGVPISIEHKAGTRRTIRNDRGEVVYDRLLSHDYGFIDNTTGRDGDEVDVILANPPAASTRSIFIASMIDLGPDVEKRSDEDKILIGFRNLDEARRAFLSMYPPEFLGGIGRMTTDELKAIVEDPKSSDPKDPFAFAFDSGLTDDERRLQRLTDRFEESEHPRERSGQEAGQFTSKGSGGGEGSSKSGHQSERVQRAIQSQVRTGQHEQAIADRSEKVLSKHIGIPRTRDNSAFDLRNDEYGIEVKTLVNGKNEKITMSKAALGRKLAEQRADGIKAFTVVVDRRSGGLTGNATYYVKEGLGSFRVSSMKKMSISDLRELVSR